MKKTELINKIIKLTNKLRLMDYHIGATDGAISIVKEYNSKGVRHFLFRKLKLDSDFYAEKTILKKDRKRLAKKLTKLFQKLNDETV